MSSHFLKSAAGLKIYLLPFWQDAAKAGDIWIIMSLPDKHKAYAYIVYPMSSAFFSSMASQAAQAGQSQYFAPAFLISSP